MKVFISWSGNASKVIAEALNEWLPKVIQRIEPWMSAQDIGKGADWGREIGKELSATDCGIICLTPDNLEPPWILYEAGALSKTLESARVCPYLYNVKATDIKGPLSKFQATVVNKSDTLKLVKTFNKALEKEAIKENQIEEAFALWWPKLEEKLKGVPKAETEGGPARTDREILEEILSVVRSESRWREGEMGGDLWNQMLARNLLARGGIVYPAGTMGIQYSSNVEPGVFTINSPGVLTINSPKETEKKIEADAPCHCGSGKKYKECHGKKEGGEKK